MPRLTATSLSLCLTLLVGGCGMIDVRPVATAGGACDVDGDCVAGLKCFQKRICVAAHPPETPVVLRLTPPLDSGLLIEQFQVTLDAASQAVPVKLVMTEPAVVSGTVTQHGNLLAESIPGTLFATSPSAVDGHPLTFTATSYLVQKVFPGSSDAHGFELRVQPGYLYALAFWPESQEIPPHYTTITAGVHIEDWQIELPGATELLHVNGVFVMAGEPLAGLRVALQDEQGRVCSTQAVTDSYGAFALLVDPSAPAIPGSARAATLHFEPVAAKDPLPRGHMLAIADLDKAALKNAPIALGKLDLGNPGPAAPMQVRVRSVSGAKVAGARVTVARELPQSATDTTAKLRVVVTGYADADGVFATSMPPGAVTVTVVPPQKSTSAMRVWQGKFQGGEVVVACPSRRLVHGTIQDIADHHITDSQVSLRRVDVDDKGSAADDQPIAAIMDGKGGFSALVDPGTYAVWVEPSKKSGLPRVLATRVEVPAEGSSEPLKLVLPAPMVLSGSVLSANGKAVSSVLVDVLTVKAAAPLSGKPDKLPPPSTGSSGVLADSHLLATTVSGSAGTFEVLLAPGQVLPGQ